MGMKKIIIFSALYYPNLGGVENYTYYLSRELLKKGHTVILVTSNVFNLADYEVVEEMEIYRLPCFNLLNGRFPVIKPSRKWRVFSERLKKEKFDLVIINTRFYLHSVYGALLAKKNRIKSIVIEHGATHFSINNFWWDKIGHVYEHIETVILKLLCKSYYGVSLKSCEWLKHFHIEAQGVLYDAVDLDFIKKNLNLADRKLDFRKKYGLKSSDKIIVFIGRLVTQKGVIQLVEAAKIIQSKYPNWKVLIVGDGPLYESLKDKKSTNTLLVGRIDHADVITLLNQSDIFCLPSDEEGFCLAAVEAMAAKTYMVSTKVGIVAEIIDNDDYGTILSINTTQEIVRGLEKAISRIDKDVAIKKTYKKLLAMGLSWECLANKIEEIC